MERGQKTQKLVLAAFFAALTAVASQLIIPLPFTPVPLSLSLAAVYLTGALLDKKTAFWAQGAYLLLGACGAPIFSGMQGGLQKLCGPTGGYLLAYPLMSFLTALLLEKWGRGLFKSLAAMTVSLTACYLIGTVQLMAISGTGLLGALSMAVFPFIPLDLVKVAVSAALAGAIYRVLARTRLMQY